VSLRAKLLTIVGAAGLGLLLVIGSTALIGMRETRDLKVLEGRLLPKLALGPRLEADFDRLGRGLQDAVAAEDPQALEETRAIRDQMFERIATAPNAISPEQGRSLRESVDSYYEAAYDVSSRLINQETGEAIMGAMAAMQVKRAAAADALAQATSLDYRQFREHFSAIQAERATASWLRLGVSATCLALVLFLTIKLSRDVLMVVEHLSLGFRRFAHGDFSRPIPVTTEDEVGRLSTEANSMAEKLQTTLGRLSDTSADLARANEELESFSYSVAHDLRAPLRAINGYCSALIEDLGEQLEGRSREYLGRAAAAAERMGHLIDALLALSRVSRSAVERSPVDLAAVARSVIAQLRATAPDRNIDFVAGEALTVDGDPTLLRALLENLLGNAWKFTANRAVARIEFGRTASDGGATFLLRDNGAGFNMEYASRLFAPFQRLHSEREFAGTGIGLATVRRIVRRHGGTIRAEGAVDAGATFFFTLHPHREQGYDEREDDTARRG
jgi:signal transduction histidine kinase